MYMNRKKIRFFRDNIRHMFILYAIIPAFLIACLSMGLIFIIWQYSVSTENHDANKKVNQEIEKVIGIYGREAMNLAKDVSLVASPLSMNKLVEIRSVIYKSFEEAGYPGTLYVLDEELHSVLPYNNEMPPFLVDYSCFDWGIIRKIRANPGDISLNLGMDNGRILCIGTAIQEEGKVKGYLIVTIDGEEFQPLLAGMLPRTMITDENGWVYSSNTNTFQDEFGRFVREYDSSSGFIQYEEKGYYFSKSVIYKDKLRVYSITSHGMETNMFYTMGLFILFVFTIIIVITYFITKKVSERSTKDISKIAEAFEQLKKGDLECALNIDSSVEFKEIGEAYNLMLTGLKDNIKEKEELTQYAAFAQVKQLEAQFNPHFLFNTLDNIRFMNKIDVEASDKMIVALSTLLRYSISDAQEEIEVEEDMKYTESYLSILKIRYNRRFTYEIYIEEKIKHYLIPKLMIQSIIENAVKHGYEQEDNLKLTIRGYQKGDDLIFICEDNGGGMSEKILKQIRENLLLPVNRTNHHGIYNIHRRIQLMYHEGYGVTLESKRGQGTIVTLTLPVRMDAGKA